MIVKLNAEQRAALQEWVDAAKPVMRLSHWYIVAKDSPPDDDPDSFAGSYIRDNSDHAGIHLGDSFWEETPDEQRETLAHELIHCHLYRLHTLVADRLNKADRETASSMEEVAIEQLARIIAPLLPIPKIPPSRDVPADEGGNVFGTHVIPAAQIISRRKLK